MIVVRTSYALKCKSNSDVECRRNPSQRCEFEREFQDRVSSNAMSSARAFKIRYRAIPQDRQLVMNCGRDVGSDVSRNDESFHKNVTGF